ncbi:hypothetical protein ACQJBY_036240 [Aegilops geniculata]
MGRLQIHVATPPTMPRPRNQATPRPPWWLRDLHLPGASPSIAPDRPSSGIPDDPALLTDDPPSPNPSYAPLNSASMTAPPDPINPRVEDELSLLMAVSGKGLNSGPGQGSPTTPPPPPHPTHTVHAPLYRTPLFLQKSRPSPTHVESTPWVLVCSSDKLLSLSFFCRFWIVHFASCGFSVAVWWCMTCVSSFFQRGYFSTVVQSGEHPVYMTRAVT